MLPQSSPLDNSPNPNETAQGLAQAFQILVLFVGLVFLLGGAYYAWGIANFCITSAQNPANLEAPISEMAKALSVENEILQVDGAKIPIGKVIGGVFLIIWYVITAWISLLLMTSGGKIILGPSLERRAFLSAMREYFISIQKEKEGQGK